MRAARPVPNTNENRTSDTRERIVAAARTLFSARGTSATSMRSVAAGAGVTIPGLYYHFDSKADLIHAVFAAEGLDQVLTFSLDPDLPGGLEERVRARAERELARMIEHAEFLRLMLREAVAGDPDAREVGNRLREAWLRQWREVVGAATDLAPDADLDAAAAVITSALWGLFVDFLTLGDERVAERVPALGALVAWALRGER